MVDQKPLTLERLYASPSLSGPTPQGVKYSPDGTRVTFLKARADEAARFDLWQFDVATGEQSMLVDSKLLEPEEVELSEEEKALRERKRIAGRKGIVSYDWGTADTILVPLGGDLHLVTLPPADGRLYDVRIDAARAAAFGLTAAQVQAQVDEAATGLGGGQTNPADMENLVVATTENGAVRLSDVADIIAAPRAPAARQLTNTDAFEYDAKVSPGGKFVSFVRDGAVYAIDLASGTESRLTPLAEPENAISYGVAEFVAQEEMSRYTGYWWSPDSRYLAYTKVDESTVDIIPRFDIRAEDVAVIEQRYPRAGRPNAIVDLFVRDMETGEAVEIDWRRDDWGSATDQYLARVNWFKDAKLVLEIVDRDQTTIARPYFINGQFDDSIAWHSERQSKWVNLSFDIRETDARIVWTTEESGYRHVVRHSDDGGIRFVTNGEWSVDTIAGQDGSSLFFMGYKDTPLERHLYSARLSGGETTRITELGKSWSITMSPDGQSFVGTSSSPTQPSQTGLYRVPDVLTDEELETMGAKRLPDSNCIDLTPMSKQVTPSCPEGMELIAWIEENALDESHPYAPYLADHTVPEYGTLTAEDGQTLYYSIQLPPNFDASKKYPALIEVYGGPHVQTVTRNWERMSDQFYSREGYVVFRLDNRGSSNRGKKFEDVIYRQTGGPEVRDQLLGVEWLKSQPFVDADRVGIQGWSYGGYMTLMTILQAPEGTFAAAVAGAPVTDWTLYDTFYTERYMDTPQDNPDGYEKSSVFYHLDRLEGEMTPLLLIHGMADDNVTFDNTTRLMAELQEQGRHFELMTYPGQRHGIRGEALQVHLMRTRMAFLERKLKRK
jgi:dipeptidyl-peptidase-4